jgi:hypothetical protein
VREFGDLLAAGRVKQPCRVVVGRRRQQPSIRAESHGFNRSVIPDTGNFPTARYRQHLHFAFANHFPVICCQQLSVGAEGDIPDLSVMRQLRDFLPGRSVEQTRLVVGCRREQLAIGAEPGGLDEATVLQFGHLLPVGGIEQPRRVVCGRRRNQAAVRAELGVGNLAVVREPGNLRAVCYVEQPCRIVLGRGYYRTTVRAECCGVNGTLMASQHPLLTHRSEGMVQLQLCLGNQRTIHDCGRVRQTLERQQHGLHGIPFDNVLCRL